MKRLAAQFAEIPELPEPVVLRDKYGDPYGTEAGMFDDMLDTEGFWLDPALTGEPESHHRKISLRYVFGEASVLDRDPNVLKAIFILGAGGSGKGSIGTAMFGGRGLKAINQDKHLERFYKEAGKPLSRIGDDYGLFKKARSLSRKERDWHAKRRRGLLVDMTGWEYTRTAKSVNALRELGYDVSAVAVVVRLKTALERNRERGRKGGRKVPGSFIKTAHARLAENLPRYKRLFGRRNLIVIDNDAPMDPAHWAKEVAPALARAGDKLLARPLRNPIGLEWIAAQERAQREESTNRPVVSLPPSVCFEAP